MISILIHAVGFGFLLASRRNPVLISDQPVIHRFTVRLLDPDVTKPKPGRSAGSSAANLALHNELHALAPGGNLAPVSYIPPQIAHLPLASQTLVQPDALPDLPLPKEVQIPVLTIWSANNSPIKQIVPPPPQEAKAANVKPSFVKPNHEVDLAEVNVSSTAFVTEAPALPSSTTAPLFTREPKPLKEVPEMASKALQQPTPARVISISNIQARGPVVIPLANQSSQTASSEALAPLRPEKSAGEGNGNPASKQNGSGAGQSAGDQAAKATTASGSAALTAANTGSSQGSHVGSSDGAQVGSGPDNESNVTRISLPKDGHFGVVVVGSSLAEEYPETVEVWKGRLVYTVYLHVGTSKNWILQYSLPRAEEATQAGSIIRPEAPWPYEMVRPLLALDDFNSEAILVHGFINLAGRFDRLAIVFPPEFAQPKFLLRVLQQWQFRAAQQNGKPAAVEVLLIIPAETQ